ncbi:unnamed protein product [Clonostachys rosea]|uniref:Uncharacterized protein n=1 Tax=Bionectria ochroleuca TaxID=29856 RepID=A0ABY6TSK6_BIOOC|nr:unnamed protein product [Clonostachys rosea]
MGNPSTNDEELPSYKQATQGNPGPSQQTDTVTSFHRFIKTVWPGGIQEVRDYGQAREFKLKGHPWWPARDGPSGPDASRRLIKTLMEALYDMGWVLQSTVDLRKQPSKDVLVFCRQSPPPPKCEWVCISFDRQDRLIFVEPPAKEIRDALHEAFGSAVSSVELTKDHFEIRFHGYAWTPSGEDTVKTPLKLLQLLDTMETFGFSLYSSVKTMNNDQGADTDEIIMKRQIE